MFRSGFVGSVVEYGASSCVTERGHVSRNKRKAWYVTFIDSVHPISIYVSQSFAAEKIEREVKTATKFHLFHPRSLSNLEVPNSSTSTRPQSSHFSFPLVISTQQSTSLHMHFHRRASESSLWINSWLFKKRIIYWNLIWPPPCNSDHQDYDMFSRGFLLTLTFHCYREGAISNIEISKITQLTL